MNPSSPYPWDEPAVDRLLALALDEDLGAGDITSRVVLGGSIAAVARVRAKDTLVVAGTDVVLRLYGRLGAVEVARQVADGTRVERGTLVLELRGDAALLLAGERAALNLLQHLSGVATLTRRCVDAVAGTRCIVRDTRKTLPGLRSLEKYAVRVGGGTNHRLRLDDGVLIKDNHIALMGGVEAAVKAARAARPDLEIEVECRSEEEVTAALRAGADVILLDNMSVVDMEQAVRGIAGRARVEASGGIGLQNLREIAQTGVDYVAMGCLTHSAPAVDLSMAIEPAGSGT